MLQRKPTAALDISHTSERGVFLPLQYAHEGCIQRWINEKGNRTCEICHGPFRDSFADPPPPDPSRSRTIPISILPHMLAIRRTQSVRHPATALRSCCVDFV